MTLPRYNLPMELPLAPEQIRVDPTSCSTVYGPVRSWRVGWSLGIDLICVNSVCSFDCVYCQLGRINVRINERRRFVPSEKVRRDLEASEWRRADVVTFSGSGEPTLAANLGEAIQIVKEVTGKPTLVLTNGTLLGDAGVRAELAQADRVFVKLDAATEESFRRVNRPVDGVTLETVVRGSERFRDEYRGWLGVQMMFLPNSKDSLEDYLPLLERIRPNEVQVNTPTRPYPDGWYLESRGSHDGVSYPARPLKPLPPDRLREIEDFFEQHLPGVLIKRAPVAD
ncbi:MAG: hypothetical protein Kow00109_04500 [Acidobacteriota bacterium]